MVFVEAHDYRFRYPGGEQDALAIDSLTIEQGSFCVVAGASGSGKTTFLAQLSGSVGRKGNEEGTLKRMAEQTACVWQNPQTQIVTDRTEYEIVFGLENQGMPRDQMERRLAEVVTYFGLEEWMECDTMTLSGGQMQSLTIASAIAMNPDLLLLDEPTSQLDPVAAGKIYELLRQINEELGITVIVSEQRLDKVIALADQMIWMRQGKIVAEGTPQEVWQCMGGRERRDFFPEYANLSWLCGKEETLILSPKKARMWFEANYEERKENSREKGKEIERAEENVTMQDLCFRFTKKGKDVVRECSASFPIGAITCIVGGNGSGKTTLLEILSGRYRPYRGTVRQMPNRTAMLPQQPRYLFVEDTLGEIFQKNERIRELAEYFGINRERDRHPRDLSGGELQRLALASVFAKDCECYLLDEPTKGLDRENKRKLGSYLKELVKENKTVILVSHDMEFAARYASYMALMFRGQIPLVTDHNRFFIENQFYTTGLNRVASGVSARIVIEEDIEVYAEKKVVESFVADGDSRSFVV